MTQIKNSILLIFLLTSCQLMEPTRYTGPEPQKSDYAKIEWLYNNWWEIFHDLHLNALVEQALSEHPSLKIAEDRIRIARLQAKEAKSFLFPTLSFNADSTKTIQSKTGIFAPPPPPSTVAFPINYTQTEFNLDLEYEFDFFEKNKNLWRSALGEAEAVKAEKMIAKLLLSLSVAEVYFKLQTDLIKKDLMVESETVQNGLLELTLLSIKNGLSTNIIRSVRENSLSVAKNARLASELEVLVDKHRLSELIAAPFCIDVEEFYISLDALEALIHSIYALLLTELPLDLIAYRPDIQALLFRIRSAGFEIKAAEALFYPNINLMALTGQQTIHLSKLFNGESLYGMWGPAIHLPIFTGGLLRANLGVKKAEYDLLTKEYEETVLIATRQVLDAKAALLTLQDQLENAKQVTRQILSIYEMTEKKRARHLASNIDLLQVKTDFLNAKDNEITILFSSFNAVLNLVRALGGGYR